MNKQDGDILGREMALRYINDEPIRDIAADFNMTETEVMARIVPHQRLIDVYRCVEAHTNA